MSHYSVSASPFFYDVKCPKHRNHMIELKNGLIGEKVWWCKECERVYHLKPAILREDQFDREEVNRQLEDRK